MLLSDRQLKDLCSFHNSRHLNLIDPFISRSIREINDSYGHRKVISYGLSSYGYDIRLGADFKVFRRIPGDIVDPKNFSDKHLQDVPTGIDNDGSAFWVLPANCYALGVSYERFNLPPTITGICMGKSTYARVGVIVNITPLEAGWRGFLTIEISNSSSSDVRIYGNEGIAQVLFFNGEPCMTTYADRAGKYQDQENEITLPKM